MVVGIHYDGKNPWPNYSMKRFKDILEFNNIGIELLYAGDKSFWEKLANCNFFIYRWNQNDWDRQIALTIIPIIENDFKIKCYPNSKSSWIYDNKIRQYYLLKAHGYPIIETNIFYDIDGAHQFIEQAEYPLVFKLTSGAGSRMVRLISNKQMARKYASLIFAKGIPYKDGLPGDIYDKIRSDKILPTIRKRIGQFRRQLQSADSAYNRDWQIHKNYMILQEFLPDNAYDTRVVVIGRRAAAFQRLNRENDFRASGSKNFSVDPRKIDQSFIKIAFEISQAFGFDSMAYDFIYDKQKKPAIIEISYTFGPKKYASKISKCPGHWDAKLNWHDKPLDVEFSILSDLLNGISLKAPSKSQETQSISSQASV